MAGIQADLVIKTRRAVSFDPRRHGSIRLVPERLDFAAFRALYASSRFVILPLTPHPLNASGVTALGEAFAMGKALIVSASDSVRDYLAPEENCLVVPPSDADALRAAIESPATGNRRRLRRNAPLCREYFAAGFCPARRKRCVTLPVEKGDSRAVVSRIAGRCQYLRLHRHGRRIGGMYSPRLSIRRIAPLLRPAVRTAIPEFTFLLAMRTFGSASTGCSTASRSPT